MPILRAIHTDLDRLEAYHIEHRWHDIGHRFYWHTEQDTTVGGGYYAIVTGPHGTRLYHAWYNSQPMAERNAIRVARQQMLLAFPI